MTGRIDAALVCGGVYHDFDFARLQLLSLLADDEAVRTKVFQDYEDLGALTSSSSTLQPQSATRWERISR